MVRDFVELASERNRGWPWPEDSSGLAPMFGEGGWCQACGTPLREQSGPLMLQRRHLTCAGAWVPYWQYDLICLERSLAEQVAARFDVQLREVGWPKTPAGEAMQIIIPTVGEAWFDPTELEQRTIEAHGTPGARCDSCGLWRWMPLGFYPVPPMQSVVLPPLQVTPDTALDNVHIAASPERFGDGFNTFRQILVRRELAELIATASPRDFTIHELP